MDMKDVSGVGSFVISLLSGLDLQGKHTKKSTNTRNTKLLLLKVRTMQMLHVLRVFSYFFSWFC